MNKDEIPEDVPGDIVDENAQRDSYRAALESFVDEANSKSQN